MRSKIGARKIHLLFICIGYVSSFQIISTHIGTFHPFTKRGSIVIPGSTESLHNIYNLERFQSVHNENIVWHSKSLIISELKSTVSPIWDTEKYDDELVNSRKNYSDSSDTSVGMDKSHNQNENSEDFLASSFKIVKQKSELSPKLVILESRSIELLESTATSIDSNWINEVRYHMNEWARSRSLHGALMVEKFIERVIHEKRENDRCKKDFSNRKNKSDLNNEFSFDEEQKQEEDYLKNREKYEILNNYPDTNMYNMVIKGWAKSGEEYAPLRAESILNEMELSTDPLVQPDIISYSTVLAAWARNRSTPGAIGRAESLVRRMEHNTESRPNTSSYNTLITAWARCATRDNEKGAIRAEEFLRQMSQLYDDDGKVESKPDVRSYTAVICGWTRCGNFDRAELILRNMEENGETRPNALAYNCVLSSLCRENLTCRADALLRHMLNRCESGNTDSRPSTMIFNTVMASWSGSAQEDAAERALDLFTTMQSHYEGHPEFYEESRPNIFTACRVIEAFSRSGRKDSAHLAMEAHDMMINLYKQGRNDELKPTANSFNELLQAWAWSGDINAAVNCEAIFNVMMSRYENGDIECRPNGQSYDAYIDAVGRCGEEGSAKQADELLSTIERLYRNCGGQIDFEPSNRSYRSVIEAWCRSGEEGCALRAEERLLQLEQFYADGGNDEMKPDARCYASAIDAWARSGETGAANHAEGLLKRMEMMYMSGNFDAKPDEFHYTSVLYALARSGEEGAPLRAEAILNRMESFHENKVKNDEEMPSNVSEENSELGDVEHDKDRNAVMDVRPNTLTYKAVILAYTKSKDPGASHRAESILRRMENRYSTGQFDVKPDLFCYTSVLHSIARSDDIDGPIRADAILKRMESIYKESNGVSVKPNGYLYSIVIKAWSASSRKDGAIMAESLLFKLIEKYFESGKDDNLKPTTSSFNGVMSAHSKNFGEGSALRAESVLNKLVELWAQLDYDSDVMPNVQSFMTCIKAWSRSGDSSGPERAELLLKKMQKLSSERGCYRLKPDMPVFNSVICAYAHSGRRVDGKLEEAEELLARMHEPSEDGKNIAKPDTFTYNTLIKYYSSDPHTLGEAERLLEQMIKLCKDKNEYCYPSGFSFATIINAYARSNNSYSAKRAQHILHRMVNLYKSGGHDVLKPDKVFYTSVINAWANSGDPDAGSKSEKLLAEMHTLYDQGNESMKPNIKSYNTVLLTHTRSGKDGINKAYELLQSLECAEDKDINPNTVTYNMLIDAITPFNDEDGANLAQKMLYKMERRKREGNNCAPDLTTYSLCIKAFSQCKAKYSATKAQCLFDHMISTYESSGNQDIRPNWRVCTLVIDAWRRSNDTEKAIRAREMLRLMIKYYEGGNTSIAPNLGTYNAVLLCCVHTNGAVQHKLAALDIAYKSFQELVKSKYGNPNDVTYSTFLRACNNLLPAGDASRISIASAIFKRCCKDGQVSPDVIIEFKRAVPSETFKTFLGKNAERYGKMKNKINLQLLPKEWTCNLRT